MRYSIDRFEEDFAALIGENGEKSEIKKEYLPENAKPGDILSFSNGVFCIIEDETEKIRNKNISKFKKLFKK